MPTAAVTGATGFIGRHLVRRLTAEGAHVRAVARDAAGAAFPAGVELRTADVTDPAALAPALAGVDVVYHLAAKLHVNDPAELRDEYEAVNVRGTRNVLEAAGGARVVVFSTVAVYGSGAGGAAFTERSPLRPVTLYAATKAAAEREAAAHGGAVVLRPAAAYGPGMKGNYLTMLRAIERRRFVLLGDGSNRRTLIHVDDLCRAALAAAAAPGGGIYNVTDGRLPTLREIAAAMASAVGRPPPRLRVPATPVRVILTGLAATARLAGKELPIGPHAVAKMTEDVAVDGSLLVASTGYRPQVGPAEGWASVVAAHAATRSATSK